MNVKCKFINKDLIRVTGAVVENLIEGTKISFTITNFFININHPLNTTTWKLRTFTPEKFFIDSIEKGMSLEYKCYFPCLTCNSGSVTKEK
jgi:hypothetical protein